MIEIINCLKAILKGIKALQNVAFHHHTQHEAGGGDEISVVGLSGELADQQNPKAHKTTHQKDESDDLESLLRLANLLEKSHLSLTNVTASQHHTKTSKLSEITSIDVNKDWNKKNITNFGTKRFNVADQLIKGIIFNLGLATVGTKQAQALIPGTLTISKVKIYADTAPVGASLIVDINKNGTTIFTTQANRPAIAAGEHADDSGTPNITSLAEGDRISVDVDQVGSTTPGGNDLLVTIIC